MKLSIFLSLNIVCPSLCFWRIPCESLGIACIDPIKSPGNCSQHPHIIYGANGISKLTSFEDLRRSRCTSCLVEEDESVYWAPALQMHHRNGTVDTVPNSGAVIYYFADDLPVKAFPPGFRIVAGDSNRRTFTLPVPDPPKSHWEHADMTQDALAQKAIGFNCINNRSPEPSLDRHFLPPKGFIDANCSQMRLELMFPSCWNGKDSDSADHKSHIQYPNLVNTGVCPPGFDVRVPGLLIEVYWDTSKYIGIQGKYVLSNGDYTGFGYHADFISGWDETQLQQAINTCRNRSGLIEDCAVFTLRSKEEAAQCRLQDLWEDCRGGHHSLCILSHKL